MTREAHDPDDLLPPDYIDLDREQFNDLVLRACLVAFVYAWYVVWLLMLALVEGWIRPEFLGLTP